MRVTRASRIREGSHPRPGRIARKPQPDEARRVWIDCEVR